jgi:hypothetical protein
VTKLPISGNINQRIIYSLSNLPATSFLLKSNLKATGNWDIILSEKLMSVLTKQIERLNKATEPNAADLCLN